MKRQLFILLIGGLIGSGGLMAQKMYKSGTGGTAMIILDTTVEAGMPLGGQTNEHKYTGIYTTSNVSNTAFVGGSLQASLDANAVPYEKLAIAMMDVANATTHPTVLGTGVTMDWKSAVLRCAGLTYAGLTGWRLPTARELTLIRIFEVPLANMGAAMHPIWYNSITEATATVTYLLDFSSGYIANTDLKISTRGYARCVKEL